MNSGNQNKTNRNAIDDRETWILVVDNRAMYHKIVFDEVMYKYSKHYVLFCFFTQYLKFNVFMKIFLKPKSHLPWLIEKNVQTTAVALESLSSTSDPLPIFTNTNNKSCACAVLAKTRAQCIGSHHYRNQGYCGII